MTKSHLNNALVAQIVARIGSEIGLLFQFGSGQKSGQLYHWSVANIDTCSAPNKHFGPRVFFSVWRVVRLPQDGERGERLTDTLSGAKHGGHHHQERALVLTSLCRTKLSIKVPHPNEIQNPDRARFDTKVPCFEGR